MLKRLPNCEACRELEELILKPCAADAGERITIHSGGARGIGLATRKANSQLPAVFGNGTGTHARLTVPEVFVSRRPRPTKAGA